MEHKNNCSSRDYSLLRKFDLEAAKRGEKVCSDLERDGEAVFVGMADSGNRVILNWRDESYQTYTVQGLRSGTYTLCMAPLAWVEGKPVYKGDVLYSTFFEDVFEVSGTDGHGQFRCTTHPGITATRFESCTWQKPKQKKEGWVVVVKDGDVWGAANAKGVSARECLYKTEELAREWNSNAIAITKITWEE